MNRLFPQAGASRRLALSALALAAATLCWGVAALVLILGAMLLPLLYFLGTLLPYLMGLIGIYGDMLSLAPGEHSLRHEW